MKSEDVAFSRLAAIGPSPAEKARLEEINAGVDVTMRQVIADQLKGRNYDPWRGGGTEKVTPVGAAPTREPGVPLLSGVPASKPIPWDYIRLGANPADEKEEPEK
jgi:hypothetical protein